ncbi:hypothetical protein LPIBR_20209 [Lacticaseibacillus paracasei]|nr:hypothetical protein LPIBR_20209 [Lacticaseibacillus paracasei]
MARDLKPNLFLGEMAFLNDKSRPKTNT